jgi:hypothetical protein
VTGVPAKPSTNGEKFTMLRFALAASFAVLMVACSSSKDKNSSVSSPSGLSYTSPVIATVGTALASLSPTVTGTVSSYSVSQALPAGLSLNTTSGVISGTPTAAAAQASYTITAMNSGGSTTFALSLTVNTPITAPSALSYLSPLAATVGTAITPLSPTVTGTVTSYSVSPALPAGLSLNTTSGVISGTPTAASARSTDTITATNSAGNTTFALALTVSPAAFPSLAWDTGNWDSTNWQ